MAPVSWIVDRNFAQGLGNWPNYMKLSYRTRKSAFAEARFQYFRRFSCKHMPIYRLIEVRMLQLGLVVFPLAL